MDRHILNPLFVPQSVVVFAGDPDVTPAPTPQAETLRRLLAEGHFVGTVTWLDISMTGTLADLAQLGVRRVSVGGALARAAWGGLQRAARLLAEQGRFDGFKDAADHHALNQLMAG